MDLLGRRWQRFEAFFINFEDYAGVAVGYFVDVILGRGDERALY